MSNYGKRYDPNIRTRNKILRESKIDLNKMMRDSNKKPSTRYKKQITSKRKQKTNSFMFWFMLSVIIIGSIVDKIKI